VLALTACTPLAHTAGQKVALGRSAGEPKILLMPLDVELAEISAAGVPTPKADWTQTARRNLKAALHGSEKARGIALVDYDPERAREAREEVEQIRKLHGLVGQAILDHQYGLTSRLPAKNGAFDWSLGPSVRLLKDVYGADYALFTHLHDTYAGWSRYLLMAAAAAFTIPVIGGTQEGFASLVDLETGQIVWFNRLLRPWGEVRKPGSAQEAIEGLLTDVPR
jgi:hypothetical protein